MFSLLFGMMLAVNLGPIASGEPAHQPQMVAHGSMVALTFGAGKAIYFSASHDLGRTFSAPMKVAESEIVPLTRHRGPRIAISNGTIVISAVVGRTPAEGPHAHGLPSDGDLIVWRSTDGGKNWSRGVMINDVPGAPTEGLHSLASDAGGSLFAAWLDQRGGHGTRLYGARSINGGITWSKNVMIYQSPDGTICECCHPSVAIDSNGEILVMWRNWLAGARDMYLSRSRDGVTFSKPEKLGTSSWQLNACPMDGGGVAIAQNRVVTAWRREHEIFLATPGEREVGIAEGVDVSITAAPTGIYAVWSTPTGVRSLAPGKKESIAMAPKGAFPNVVSLPDHRVLAAWEDDGMIVIQPVP
jgi:hypothetical protein